MLRQNGEGINISLNKKFEEDEQKKSSQEMDNLN
jgi:hypothetical protein